MSTEEVISFFCQERGIPPSSICDTKCKRNVWITRYMIWLYLHCNVGISASKLSKHFNRNVPSIFRGIRIIKHEFRYHKELCAEYHSILKKLEDASNDTPSENMEE